MSSSAGSTNEILRPANSKDPAWKYGFWPNLTNKNLVECMLCGFHSTGGIQRLKQHIVGGFSNARKCLKASPNIVIEIVEYMEQNKRKRPSSINESQERTCWDEDGSDGEDDPLGLKNVSQSRKKSNVRGSMDAFVRSDPEEIVNARLKGKQLVQKTMSSIAKKKERNAVAQKFTRFMYQAGIPFNVLRLKSFHVAMEAISNFGPGFKPPTYHEARVTFLKKEVENTTALLDLYKRSWKTFGCTIMSDGWTDKRSRHLINFLVNCPEGTYFLKSVDASDKIQDADYIFQELDKVIDEIGEQHVIQVVSDNGSAYVKAGKMLMQKRPHLFWTPCAAHCLDLILEEIAKLPLFKKAISRGRAITTFIYKHSRLLAEMRKETNGKELVRAGVTRFATAFLTLQSLYSHKAALRSLFVSRMWLQSAWAKKPEGKKVAETILSTSFWKGVCNCLRAGEPLVQVLRLVDSDDKPPMGYLYNAAEMAKDKIKVYFDFNEKTYKPIIDIIDRRLKDQLYQDLHLAGYFLNPGCYYAELERNPHVAGKCFTGFMSCVDRMVEDPDMRVTIMCQVDLYKFAHGPFAKDMAIRLRNKKQPHLWWDTIGNETMELRDVAVRILGLTCTSSACERNWSTFEHIRFIDNTDPAGIDHQIAQIGPELASTLVIVISKSGGTPETRNGLLEVQKAFREAGLDFSKQGVAITQENSLLDNTARIGGWVARFPMFDWVGGRTSEMSAVGLLPAALQGIDIKEMLIGASLMDEANRTTVVKNNPAALLALCWHWASDGIGSKDMVVLPYKDSMLLFSRYLQQLVMESLGKEFELDGNRVNQGLTVYGNKGSTDQHAYIQQLREGVHNFFVTFIEVLRDRPPGHDWELEPGVTCGDYLFGMLQGTRSALYANDRESITVTVEEINPRSVGALIALYERAVGIYASLVNINAYHQPGVEAGKKAAGEVLALQKRVLAILNEASCKEPVEPLSLGEVADRCHAPEEIEMIYKIIAHMAANDRALIAEGSCGSPRSFKVYLGECNIDELYS